MTRPDDIHDHHDSQEKHRSRINTSTVAHSPLESLKSIFSSSSSSSSSTSSSSSSASSSKSPWSYLPEDPLALAAVSSLVAVSLTLGALGGYRRYWRRIRNSDYVTSRMLDRKVWVRGIVTSVGDGGPFYFLRLRSIPSSPKALKDETLHIRIAGVDAPEMAHFGNPAQPHAQESLDWLRATLLGRRMRCQLLRKDQYNRIVHRLLLYDEKKAHTQVAVPYISRMVLPKRPLPLLMLKEGMAVVYTSGGAEFGPWGLDKMKAVEAEAKRQKKGLWGLKKFEHPADYKKRMKMAEEGMVGVEQTSKAQSREGRGVVGFLKRYLLP